jgi:hypothetical protein
MFTLEFVIGISWLAVWICFVVEFCNIFWFEFSGFDGGEAGFELWLMRFTRWIVNSFTICKNNDNNFQMERQVEYYSSDSIGHGHCKVLGEDGEKGRTKRQSGGPRLSIGSLRYTGKNDT